ncbi:DUF4259 domain-containing protein [Longimicrobium sp.]|uniref:DUF4259 domain-containing protein n=1 Tax=Longimicrobium sp. TaxID=2029185 RepID=UPI002C2520ED|nr:DUF4259 domain-containing protein [Longimicrobium sp.]HSU18094.1 DUF4259 domain-containing protein [Longimicrobium sp.]
MGAWGVGSFDNDAALDWLDTLDRLGAEALLIAFQTIAEEDERIETEQARIALAAAEAVAAARGHAAPDLPGELAEWTDAHGRTVDDALAAQAKDAVTRIRDRSELADLWEEQDSGPEWDASIAGLLERLGAGGD